MRAVLMHAQAWLVRIHLIRFKRGRSTFSLSGMCINVISEPCTRMSAVKSLIRCHAACSINCLQWYREDLTWYLQGTPVLVRKRPSNPSLSSLELGAYALTSLKAFSRLHKARFSFNLPLNMVFSLRLKSSSS